MGRPVYVETFIHTDLDRLWGVTQQADLHERWDLRFHRIQPLPKSSEEEAQRFIYETKIGLGLTIQGEGKSHGGVVNGHERTSALVFSSPQKKSLIRKGNGYWKYIEQKNGVTFLTQYDYTTRYGALGKAVDFLLFRPFIGWATAWSFDSMKQWLEDGTQPEDNVRKLLVHIIICLSLALCWVYQGLVPKLLFPETGELQLMAASGITPGYESVTVAALGGIQILVGLMFLLPLRKKWLFRLTSLALIPLGAGALIADPAVFLAPFNPGSLSIAMAGLGIAGLLNMRRMPDNRNCRRSRSGT